MSLKPDPIQPVPEETARIARAAFRKGNPLLRLRDELGAIFADADLPTCSPSSASRPCHRGAWRW
jgi:transposase